VPQIVEETLQIDKTPQLGIWYRLPRGEGSTMVDWYRSSQLLPLCAHEVEPQGTALWLNCSDRCNGCASTHRGPAVMPTMLFRVAPQ
ncbi:Hypothetical predicted protein, partial [Olea europaea subsp. europaea]